MLYLYYTPSYRYLYLSFSFINSSYSALTSASIFSTCFLLPRVIRYTPIPYAYNIIQKYITFVCCIPSNTVNIKIVNIKLSATPVIIIKYLNFIGTPFPLILCINIAHSPMLYKVKVALWRYTTVLLFYILLWLHYLL